MPVAAATAESRSAGTPCAFQRNRVRRAMPILAASAPAPPAAFIATAQWLGASSMRDKVHVTCTHVKRYPCTDGARPWMHHRRMEMHLLAITDHQVEAGRRLRQIIDAAKLTYVKAADIMGISKSNLGNWMRGDAPIQSYPLYRLCRVTGATADWVLLADPSGLPQRLMQPLNQQEPSRQLAD